MESERSIIQRAMAGVRVVACEGCDGIGETLSDGTCRGCDGTGQRVITELEVDSADSGPTQPGRR